MVGDIRLQVCQELYVFGCWYMSCVVLKGGLFYTLPNFLATVGWSLPTQANPANLNVVPGFSHCRRLAILTLAPRPVNIQLQNWSSVSERYVMDPREIPPRPR